MRPFVTLTQMPSRRADVRATAAVLTAAAVFGTTGTAQELGPDGTTPLGLGALRIVVGTLTLWVLAAASSSPGAPAGTGPDASSISSLEGLGRRGGLLVAVGGLGVAAYQPSFLAGTSRSGVALGTVVALGSGPVFAGLFDAVRRRRPPPRAWTIATAVTIAGGAVLVATGGGAARLDLVGIGCSLVAGASYALYADTTKQLILRGVGSTVALAASFTVGAALLAVPAIGEPYDWVTTVGGVALVAHLGIVTIGVAYWLYGYALRHLPVPRAVTLTLAEPATAAVLGVVVLGEHLALAGWLGIALVLVGLVLTARGSVGGSRAPHAASVASAT